MPNDGDDNKANSTKNCQPSSSKTSKAGNSSKDHDSSISSSTLDLAKQYQEILDKLENLTVNTERIATSLEGKKGKTEKKAFILGALPTLKKEPLPKNEPIPYGSLQGPSELKIYYQNIRGLREVQSQLKQAVSENNYDIIVLIETQLHPGINDSNLFDLIVYNVSRRDRAKENSKKKKGGGILIAVKNCLGVLGIRIKKSTTEELWVLLEHNSIKIILGAMYFPGKALAKKYKEFFESVEYVVSTHSTVHTKIILGDFNLADIKWEPYQDVFIPKNVAHGEAFLLIYRLALLGLYQRTNIKNSSENVLDLVYANTDALKIEIDEPLVRRRVEGYHRSLQISFDVFKL